ncbi:MAG: TolB family protein [Bacteroidota bacterium]
MTVINRTKTLLTILLFSLTLLQAQSTSDSLLVPGEKHLSNIRQLTKGGQNAEAYFSFDDKQLIFQSTRDSFQCDQIYTMDLNGENVRMVSTGKGKTTCSYFLPGDSTIIYSSTHLHNAACPPRPDYSKGYVWALHNTYDIFLAKIDGTIIKNLTNKDGYDAEATVSPIGDRMVFTSTRNGDIDLYSMNLDGTNVKQLTHEIGYDGGAFYSSDGKMICYRAYHPKKKEAVKDYQDLLKAELVRPSILEIFVMNADGSHKRQLTHFGRASFAPFFHPDGKRIIFASNYKDPKGRNFDLFLINIDGTGLEQVTFNETFDGFPMFTRDGKKLVFASNRNNKSPEETNIFIADWNN